MLVLKGRAWWQIGYLRNDLDGCVRWRVPVAQFVAYMHHAVDHLYALRIHCKTTAIHH
jgi:hypothetical protein